MPNWVDSLFDGGGATAIETRTMLFTFFLSFVMGQIIGWVYQKTHRGLSYSQSFTASMVIMPVLVAMMMMLMANNMSIAFGLLAVFAVVRFRNVLKDTRDTVFILWAIIQGMAVGTGRASLALVGVVVVSLIMFYLSVTRYGARTSFDTIVNLIFPKDAKGINDAVKQILDRHTLSSQLASIQEITADQLDASYRLTLRDPDRRMELEEELRGLDQIQRVAVFVHDDESET